MADMFSLGQAFSKPQTDPVHYWAGLQYYFPQAGQKARNFYTAGGEQDQLYNQFKNSYLSPEATARANDNAKIYSDYAKNLFANPPNGFADYSKVGDYLYGKLDDFSSALKDSGLRDMNIRLANLGIRPGSTGYDRLLNANRITNNLAPAFANTTNAIGRDSFGISGNNYRDNLLRLGLANQDALSGYYDAAATRPLNVADARYGQFAQNNKLLQDWVNLQKANTAGFETRETSGLAKGLGVVDNLLNGAVDLASSYFGGGLGGGMGGLGGGFGGMGGGGGGGQSQNQLFPYSFQQNPYATNPYQYQQSAWYGQPTGAPYHSAGAYDPMASSYSTNYGGYQPMPQQNPTNLWNNAYFGDLGGV